MIYFLCQIFSLFLKELEYSYPDLLYLLMIKFVILKDEGGIVYIHMEYIWLLKFHLILLFWALYIMSLMLYYYIQNLLVEIKN